MNKPANILMSLSLMTSLPLLSVTVSASNTQTEINALNKRVQVLEKKAEKNNTDHTSAHKKLHVKLYGLVNEGVLFGSDSRRHNNVFFVSNSAAMPRIGTLATIQVNKNTKVGGSVEIGLKANPSNQVSQTDPAPANSLDLRKIDFFVTSKIAGALHIGKGDTAINGSSEVDLSGTKLANSSDVANPGGGLFFRNSGGTKSLSSLTINNAFNNFNSILRENRVRYETPSFKGFTLKTSAIENNQTDASLWYKNQFTYIKIAGALAWISPQTVGDTATPAHGQVITGSLSTLLSMGLNATIAGGRLGASERNRDNPYFYYGKFGYQKKWLNAGNTSLSIDYGNYDNFNKNSNKGKAYGAAIAQTINAWNTTFYLGYRHFQVNQINTNVNDINTVILGALFRF